MDQVIGSGCEPLSGSVESLTDELAEIQRVTARLLLTPRYDEANLAELSVRARDVRAAIRSALVGGSEGGKPVVVHAGALARGGGERACAR
jgi:hypothetical protein